MTSDRKAAIAAYKERKTFAGIVPTEPSLRAQRSNPCFSESGYGLLRCARNDEMAILRATNWHDGQITKSLSIPSRKNIPLSPSGKSVILIRACTRRIS
jgi:hypothetical protein